jgi:hypothetical protein
MSFDRGTGLTGTGEASVLPIDKGGTGADTAAEARTNLNLGALFSDSNGKVGIGTSTPEAKLTVAGSSTDYPWIKVVSSDTNIGGEVDIQAAYLYASNDILDINSGYYSTEGSSNKPMVFTTGPSTERVRIDASGNMGIGTSAPARKLHVSDVMRLEPRNGAPSSPSKGDIYFDSSDNKLKCYDGTNWQNLF